MAIMKTGKICNISGSYDDCRVNGTRFDGLNILDISVWELLHFIFDAGSVVFN